MFLDFFDNVLRLDFSLESTKSILKGLALLEPDFSHSTDTPQHF